jgi:anion-transporting  ArsA/GET3 family ATPase
MKANQRSRPACLTISELLTRRLLIVVGKGGVGKTTISAVLGSLAARVRGDTLAMETDARAPLAAAFGQVPSMDPVGIAPGLATMVLDGRHALEEYLQIVVPGRMVLKAVFSNKLYQYFVQAAPGLRELMMLGKVYYELERKPAGQRKWEMVVLDAAASGQALGLLKMPSAAHDTFGESIVGREAHNIGRMLHEPRLCAIILVTTAEPMALAETLETHAALSELKLEVGAIVLNRYKPKQFGAEDVARLRRRSGLRRELNHLDHLSALANQELERTTRAREALTMLRSRTESPIIEVREYRNLFGAALVRRLTDDLATDEMATAHPG